MTTQEDLRVKEEVSLPVSELKTVLQTCNDEALRIFMHGYAIGFAADQFIGVMVQPGQRVEFFTAIAKTYPEDWKKTVELLAKTVNDP